MEVKEIARFEDRLADEATARRVLCEKFNLTSLIDGARTDGLSVTDEDWSQFLTDVDLPKTKLQLLLPDIAKGDGIVELDVEEVDMVSGGMQQMGWAAVWTNAVVAAEAFVNVAVYANAVAVTLVAVVGGAVAVIVAVIV